MSSLVITVAADPDDIVMSATTGATALGVSGYSEPTPFPNINNAPSSPVLDGSGPVLSWKYEDVLLTFTVFTQTATTEPQARAAIAALRAALAQMQVVVTVNVNGAGDEVWTSNGPGAVTPVGPRDAVNMRTYKTEWNVSIPCFPVHA
jgi:hypothetical protein